MKNKKKSGNVKITCNKNHINDKVTEVVGIKRNKELTILFI